MNQGHTTQDNGETCKEETPYDYLIFQIKLFLFPHAQLLIPWWEVKQHIPKPVLDLGPSTTTLVRNSFIVLHKAWQEMTKIWCMFEGTNVVHLLQASLNSCCLRDHMLTTTASGSRQTNSPYLTLPISSLYIQKNLCSNNGNRGYDWKSCDPSYNERGF